MFVLHAHLKPSFAANFTSKRKKKKKKKKRRKRKQPKVIRGNGNVPVFTVAHTTLIKPKLLLKSFSNKYFSTILTFS